MVIAFNQKSVSAQPAEPGAVRQRLLTEERVKGTNVLLDRVTLKAGATVRYEASPKSAIWLQLLEGEATLKSVYTAQMSHAHSAFLPPRLNAILSTDKGATLLRIEVLDGERTDPSFSIRSPLFTVTNWMREPVLKSERDGRKRISLVTESLCGMKAFKAEMVIYPSGTTAPTSYHHVGADSFMYFLNGDGTAWANEQPFPVHQGDFVYFPDREWHHLKAADDNEMRFLVFYVPGEYKTVGADPSKTAAWRSTGRDISGGETAQDERKRLTLRWIG
jgi:quercetin dioxygenase-like cupin family protein